MENPKRKATNENKFTSYERVTDIISGNWFYYKRKFDDKYSEINIPDTNKLITIETNRLVKGFKFDNDLQEIKAKYYKDMLKNPTLATLSANNKIYTISQGWEGSGERVYILFVDGKDDNKKPLNQRLKGEHRFKSFNELKSWLKHATDLTAAQIAKVRANPTTTTTRKTTVKTTVKNPQAVRNSDIDESLIKRMSIKELTNAYLQAQKDAFGLHGRNAKLYSDKIVRELLKRDVQEYYGLFGQENFELFYPTKQDKETFPHLYKENPTSATVKNPTAKEINTRATTALLLVRELDNVGFKPLIRLSAAEKAIVKGYPRWFKTINGQVTLKDDRAYQYFSKIQDDSARAMYRENPTKTAVKNGLYIIKEWNNRVKDYVEFGHVNANSTFEALSKAAIKYKKEMRDLVALEYKGTDYKKIPLHKRNPKTAPVKKPNFTNADFKAHQKMQLAELARMFQGVANGNSIRLLEPDIAPPNKWRLGYLVQMKIKRNGLTIPIEFDGESMLSADTRKTLWVVGKDARIENGALRQLGVTKPNGKNLSYIGDLFQLDYVTAKKHIENGETVRFFHKLGEADKIRPQLFIDKDNFPIIVGGNYDIWNVGIVN
jgi:hypothetical protein